MAKGNSMETLQEVFQVVPEVVNPKDAVFVAPMNSGRIEILPVNQVPYPRTIFPEMRLVGQKPGGNHLDITGQRTGLQGFCIVKNNRLMTPIHQPLFDPILKDFPFLQNKGAQF